MAGDGIGAFATISGFASQIHRGSGRPPARSKDVGAPKRRTSIKKGSRAPFNPVSGIKMAGDGIEPPTQGFSVPRSTTELPGREKKERKMHDTLGLIGCQEISRIKP